MEGTVSLGLFVAFVGLLGNVSRPVSELSAMGERLQDIGADLDRISDVERYPPAELATPFDPAGFKRVSGRVLFNNVDFAYGPQSPLIVQGVSMELLPGRRTALVGGSGSGKSTVGKLVAGIVSPRSGWILLDGRDRSQLTQEELSLSVAYVDQEASLFEGTIRDNVALWDDTITDDEVMDALHAAAISDLVLAQPKGLRSMVEESGRNFSGGQRQRFALARALVRSPSLLVLDEATSALDAETERVVDDNLRRLGCACLIIAHRLSTVRDADEIVVLKEGHIVERGRHADLMRVAGEYYRLVSTA